MSTVFTDDQELLRAAAGQFTLTEILPAMGAAMQSGSAEPWPFALGLWKKAAELGFIGLSTSEEMGGAGLGVKTEIAVVELLGNPIATNIDAHNLTLRLLEYNGSEYQKEKYGKPGARGEICFAAAITDPAGSMNFPEWSIRVDEVEDGYIINGTKNFCTNGGGADVYAIFTNDWENGYPMGAYLVEADTPGLEMGEIEPTGRVGTNTRTIYLTDVKVPKENKIPSADLGNAPWLALGYLDCAIIFLNMARNTLNQTIEFLKNRTRNGRPLIEMPTVAHRIVNLEMEYEKARALIYNAADLWDAGTPDLRLHSMAKIAAAEANSKIAHDCVVLHGGYAYTDMALMAAQTNAPIGHVGECPNDFHRDLIARLMGVKLDSWLNDPVG